MPEPTISPASPVASTTPIGFAAVLRAVASEHLSLIRFAASYLAFGGATLLVFHRPWPIHVTTGVFALSWLAGGLIWVAIERRRRPRPVREILTSTRMSGALLVGAIAVPLQVTFQSLKQSIGPVIGFRWDDQLSAIDVSLHGGHQAWEWLAFVYDVPGLLRVINVAYILWFFVMLGFIVWLSWTNARALRQQALLAFMSVWALGGTVLAAIFSSAGPVYQPSYQELASRLRGSFAEYNEHGIMAASKADQWLPFGGVSAFPSMHVGAAVIVALTLMRRSRALGATAWVYVALIEIGSVVLGWHYAIDGYAAFIVALACWSFAGAITQGDAYGGPGAARRPPVRTR